MLTVEITKTIKTTFSVPSCALSDYQGARGIEAFDITSIDAFEMPVGFGIRVHYDLSDYDMDELGSPVDEMFEAYLSRNLGLVPHALGHRFEEGLGYVSYGIDQASVDKIERTVEYENYGQFAV